MVHPTPDGPALRIYMPSEQAANYIDCWCTRWDEDNYNITIETFLGSANRNLLFSHMIPGGYSEKRNLLGWIWVRDITYPRNSNTLWLEPQNSYGISSVRTGRSVVVKSASDTVITPDYFNVKLECVRIISYSDFV